MSNKKSGSNTGERRGSSGIVKASKRMARAADSVPASAGGEVHEIIESHPTHGLAGSSGGDAVQRLAESQDARGPSSPDSKAPSKDGGEVQSERGRQTRSGLAESSEGGAVQRPSESQSECGPLSSDADGCGAVQKTRESHRAFGRSALTADIEALQEGQIRRKFCIGLVNKQTNAAKALVRRYCGFNSNVEQDESDREKINKRAAKIVECVLAGKDLPPEDSTVAKKVVIDLDVVSEALAPLLTRRSVIEKEMRRLAKTLPVYSWAKEVRGLGDLGLAVIVAEAGDLANYPHVRMLWKRLGLAPYDGKAFSHWRRKGGLSAEEWTEAGYAPRRRAEIHSCVGEPLLKCQIESATKTGTKYGLPLGPYGGAYVARRDETEIAHHDWTKAHSHGDAMRIMTKKLLADLWQAWRGSVAIVVANESVAHAEGEALVQDDGESHSAYGQRRSPLPQDAAPPATVPRERRRGSMHRLKASRRLARADSVPGAPM